MLGLLLTGCAQQEVGRVATAIHAPIYLPRHLPAGLRLRSARSLGHRMAYILYAGSGGRSVSLFESPDPIARPPGAWSLGAGMLVSVRGRGTGSVTSIWLRRPGAYVQVMAAGMDLRTAKGVALSLTPSAQP